MSRDRALRALLLLAGLALVACIYPLAGALLHPRTTDVLLQDQMILGIYFPIGIFLLLAVRNPSANRTLIACFAWSTLSHDSVMALQSIHAGTLAADLPPLAVIAVVCVSLLALLPSKVSGAIVGRPAGV